MIPEITTIASKKLVGTKKRTCLAQNDTFELWNTFMKNRKLIPNPTDSNYYSVQVYDKNNNFYEFTPNAYFDKWASLEVPEFEEIPSMMECLEIPAGEYAVFIHKGSVKDFPKTISAIIQWVQNSKYEIDNRPHFEILTEKYLGPQNPDSEETVWIPITETT